MEVPLFSVRSRRLLALGGTAALSIALTGNTPATADTQSFNDNGISFTVTGGPVALMGSGGANCAEPDNANAAAQLSRTVTVTITSLPEFTQFAVVSVGLNAGYQEIVDPSETTFTIPVGGGGNSGGGFACSDADSPTSMPVFLNTYDVNFTPLGEIAGELTLSAVD
ncbi:MAG: hypothetical protein JWP74_64 [Marmoricola sp.]|nr:hypothetical protein [Marmoricola sp.]